jgi:hypothetical protein
MSLARDEDFFHDGVRIVVDWDSMRVGHSVFVPGVNTSGILKTADKIFRRRGWKARYRLQPENHILGVRIWRVT